MVGRCAGRVRGTELSLLFSLFGNLSLWFPIAPIEDNEQDEVNAKYVWLSLSITITITIIIDYHHHHSSLSLTIIIASLYEACCSLLLHIMGLGENIITYSIANIMSAILSLYSVLFRMLVNESKEKSMMNIYVNLMKAITSKMLTKPLLFKYYCVNISIYITFIIIIITITIIIITHPSSFILLAVQYARRRSQWSHLTETKGYEQY